MNAFKISMITSFFLLALTSYGQEPQKMQVQPMKKEVQKVSAPEKKQESETKATSEDSLDVKKINAAPVRKAESKALEPKERVVEPKN